MKETIDRLGDWAVFQKYRFLSLAYIVRLVLLHGPIDMIRELRRYPWIRDLLKFTNLMKRLTDGRTGEYRRAVALILSVIAKQLTEKMLKAFNDPGSLIYHEDLVPPEIFFAMGLNPWCVESMGIVVPLIEPGGMERYIDACENAGVPADVCSFTKQAVGLFLDDAYPPSSLPLVTSNMPCDGGMASYTVIREKRQVPMYSLDVPYHFRTERAMEYFVDELENMISFLEKNSGGRMDWARLKTILEGRNRMAELEYELWDMVRMKPSPMAAEAIWLSHIWAFNLFPGDGVSIRLFETLVRLCKKNVDLGRAAVTNERYRAVLWNPPTIHMGDLFAWAEKAYGVTMIMDMLTYNRQPFVDTSSPAAMLKGLSYNIMDGPMVRHTRGPRENYIDDIFSIYKSFQCDMIWIAGHIGCKNSAALYGMLREECRRLKVPLLIIDYDLVDPRIENRDGIIRQVEHFMENIMRAERLDR